MTDERSERSDARRARSWRAVLRDWSRDTRGGVVALFGFGLPVLGVVVAGAVELAEVSSARTKLQSYVDTAAVSGARELSVDRSSSTAERTRLTADAMAGPLKSRWSVATAAEVDLAEGSVKVTQSASRPSMFGSLLPPGGFHIVATATATSSNRKPLCVLGLQTGAKNIVDLRGSSTITAPDCLVQSDSDLLAAGSSAVKAGAVRTVGAAAGSISPAPLTDAPVIPDPFAALNVDVPLTCTDLLTISLLGGTTTLNPGVHCGVLQLLGSNKLVLNPGEHYFVGPSLSLLGDTEITGTDVVVVFKGQLALTIGGNTTLSLEGRKSGPLAGFVLISDRSFTGTLALSTKNAKKLLGTIYLPNATLGVSGSGNRVADQSPWTVVVAKEITMSGSPDLVINANYSASPIPIPAGVGPGSIRLEQ